VGGKELKPEEGFHTLYDCVGAKVTQLPRIHEEPAARVALVIDDLRLIWVAGISEGCVIPRATAFGDSGALGRSVSEGIEIFEGEMVGNHALEFGHIKPHRAAARAAIDLKGAGFDFFHLGTIVWASKQEAFGFIQ